MEGEAESDGLSEKDMQNLEFFGKEEDILKQRGLHMNETGALCVFGYYNERLVASSTVENGFEQANGLQNQDCRENGRMDEIDNVELVDNVRERSRVCENEEDGGKKGKKEVGAKAPEVATRRVLRSSSSAGNDLKKGDNTEDKDNVAGKGVREYNGNEGKMVDVDRNRDRSCNEVRTEVKHKRGRPPKVKKTDRSDSMGGKQMKMEPRDQCEDDGIDKSDLVKEKKELKRKRGRPPKLDRSNPSNDSGSGLKQKWRPPKLQRNNQSDDHGVILKRKRGRPPKVQKESSNKSIGELGEQKYRCEEDPRVHEFDGSSCLMREKRKKELRTSSQEEESDESESEAKKRLRKLHGRPSKLLGSNQSDCGGRERKGGKKTKGTDIGVHTRSGAKKMVRDRIVELLLAAGWTVEYRPRKGREYSDAVYVNPEGKTHWSVTLAYKVYKDQCEFFSNDPKTSANGTPFALLSEEETSILRRKSQKERNCKGKSIPKWKGEDTDGEVVTLKNKSQQKLHKANLHKEKLRKQKLKLAASYHGKSLKRKLKRSNASQKLDGTSPSKISMSIKNHRRHKVQPRKRCALLARNSLEGAESQADGYMLYEGKRTLLGWMIDSASVPPNAKVQYMICKKSGALLEGLVTKDGVRCNCCNEVFSVSDFEIHAGSELNRPFENLYIENSKSILQCLLDSWNKQDESQRKGFHFVDVSSGDPNDDTCAICGDGGDLICCDGCPSTFHQGCLDIKKFPSGDWFCVHCSCKICGKVGEATCQRHNDDNAVFSPLLTCCLCEEKYHQSCIKENSSMVNDSSDPSFCGEKCQKLSERLQALLGVKQQLPDGFSCTLLCRFDLSPDISLCEASKKIECNSKLAVAFFVMDECFSPLVDHRTGTNLLQNIVYNFGSNFNRLNYSRFFTAILERGDEIIGVASIRIHGNQLAEMPFIGTRYMYRRQGMCRRLMSGIESALCSLDVEKLVIPAVPELTATWTSVFGFNAVEDSSKQKIRNLNMLVFPRVDMLQKPLLKHKSALENMMPTDDGLRFSELKECHTMDNKASISDSAGLDSVALSCETAGNTHDVNGETADVESQSQAVDGCFEDKANIKRETNNLFDNAFDINGHAQLVADGEIRKVINTTVLNPQKTAGSGDDRKDEIKEVESQSQVIDGCFEDKTNIKRETNDLNSPESGSDVKGHTLSGSDGKVQEGINTTGLNPQQDPGIDVDRQAEDIAECHNAIVALRPDIKPLGNVATDTKIHRFECHIA